MSIQEQADRVLRESYRTRNRAEVAVIEFGRRPYNPRRRMTPLNDRYDAVTNWLVIGFVLACLVFVGIGFGQVVLWAERAVRHG